MRYRFLRFAMPALQGRVILVTGASRGIGFAITQAVAREGATVLMAARHAEPLRKAAKQANGDCRHFVADVTSPRSVEGLFRRIREHHRRIDVLINNAGVFTFKPFQDTTLNDWRKNLETNLTSLFLVTKAALPLLARAKAGHIVNILSISSRKAFANCSAYCASKFGALGLSRVLAEELRSKHIRVTAILPGSTNTKMTDEFGFPISRETLLQPEDVAQAVVGALLEPARASVDEVLITPSRGGL